MADRLTQLQDTVNQVDTTNQLHFDKHKNISIIFSIFSKQSISVIASVFCNNFQYQANFPASIAPDLRNKISKKIMHNYFRH